MPDHRKVPGEATHDSGLLSRRRFLLASIGAVVAAVFRPGRADAAKRTLEVICREAWGARPAEGGMRKHRIERLTVHHSAAVLKDNRKAPARFRSHQRSHQDRGWPDIAYHLLIDRNGNVYGGRDPRFVGDTATNYNPRGHLLVMCEGNFQEQRPARAQVDALVDVLAWGAEAYGAAPKTIGGHLEYADTACPGRSLQRLIASGDIRRRVKKRIAAGGVEVVDLCGDAGRERVEDIEAGRA